MQCVDQRVKAKGSLLPHILLLGSTPGGNRGSDVSDMHVCVTAGHHAITDPRVEARGLVLC